MRDFLYIFITLSVFELQKCYLHQNGVELKKGATGNTYPKPVRNPTPQSKIGKFKFEFQPYKVVQYCDWLNMVEHG